MKKLITWVLLIALVAVSLAACKTEPTTDGLTAAKDYLYAMYRDEAVITPSDFKRIASVMVDGVSYTVEWKVDVTAGVTVGAPADNTVTIDVDEKSAADVAYVLTATLKDAEGKTIDVKFNHTVPAYKEFTWAEYVAAAKDEVVVTKGVITGIMAKSKGNSYNCLYFQDADGGYYAYNLAADPITDTKLEVGMTVRVTGTRDTYSGTYEIMNGAVEIIDSAKTEATPVDYTEIFKNAATLKDEALVAKQGLLVTIKGVEITGEDVASGYFKFKLGDKETYIRISSSVCPITKDEQTTFKTEHAAHLGWTGDATGVICIYDGAFYLSPVTVDAFTYTSLAAKSDAEMVAFEKDNLSLVKAVTEDTVIELVDAGKGYSQVKITWESDSNCAVVKDGKLTITLPETETTVKITATLTSGTTTEKVIFDVKVDAAPTDLYVAEPVAAPVKDTAYKFSLEQVTAGKTLYFTGEMDGKYLASSDKADKAVDVYLAEATGGFNVYFKVGEAKKYINLTLDASNKTVIALEDTAVTVWTIDATTGGIFTTLSDTNTYYIGTYNNYTTFSASKTSYITGDNASKVGVSQFVARFVTLATAKITAESVAAPVKDTAYKFSLEQVTAGKTLYFTGEMDGKYLASTDKADKAVDVYLAEATGGFNVYFKVGEAKKYINLTLDASNKTVLALEDTAVTVWTIDATTGGIFTTLSDTNTYYIGTYNNYTTFSASKTSYITGDNASKVGVSQFVAHFVTLSLKKTSVTQVASPVEGTAYKFSLEQVTAGGRYYFTGEMSGYYLASSDKESKAVDVFLAKSGEGYNVYFMVGEKKTYLNLALNASNKANITLDETAATVWAIDPTTGGITTALTDGNTYYIGTYNNYTTFSASKISYITGDNASKVGVSQFVAGFVTID